MLFQFNLLPPVSFVINNKVVAILKTYKRPAWFAWAHVWVDGGLWAFFKTIIDLFCVSCYKGKTTTGWLVASSNTF